MSAVRRREAQRAASDRPRSALCAAEASAGSIARSAVAPADAAALRWIPRRPARFNAVAPKRRRHSPFPIATHSRRVGRAVWTPSPSEGTLASRAHGRIPWTHFLADVASEDPVANALLDRVRKRPAVLDRPVSEAPGRIEKARAEKRVGGAALEASDAGAAELGDRIVGRQIEVRDDLREQQV